MAGDDTPTRTAARPVPIARREGCPFSLPDELQRLQAECPVSRVGIWNGSEPWLVTRYEDVRTVLSSPQFSSDAKRPGYPTESPALAEHRRAEPMMLVVDPPEHTRLRRIFARYFSIRGIERLRPQVQEIIDELIDQMLAGPPPADLVSALTHPLPGRAVSGLIGVGIADRAMFEALVTNLSDTTTAPQLAAESQVKLGEFVAGLADEKRRQPGEDIVSWIVNDPDLDLTIDEIISNTRLLVIAAFETTVRQLGLAVLALLQHPDQLELLRSDPSLVPGAVEELLRFTIMDQYPRPRVAIEDVEIGGQPIKAGDGVLVSLAAANKDPETFPEPDRFDIHRDNARMQVGFSFGPHQCLGQAVARMEIQLAIETLLRRVPTLALAVEETELRFTSEQVMNGLRELPVTW
jgi:cytochrome P450